MFVRIWQYDVPAGAVSRFVSAYGAGGDWARLFGRADGFAGTELFRSADSGDRFLTIDRWRDRSSWTSFLEQWQEAYRALDVTLAQLTAVQSSLFEGWVPSPRELDEGTGLGTRESNGR